jgi:Undecaprenyl-phosphate glucose phosphotransferase
LTLQLLRKKQYHLRKVIIIGDNTATAQAYVSEISKDSKSGVMIIGYVGDKMDGEALGLEKLGAFKELEKILDKYRPTDAVFAIDAYDKRHLIRLVNLCDDRCVKVYFLPVIYGFFKSSRQIEQVGSTPLINIHSTPLDEPSNAFIKRAMDIIGASILLILTSPIMIATAIGVKISSPGPIFFKQRRVGKMGKRFMMLKFRSMRINNEQNKIWSNPNDSRKTKFGAFIRRTAIDELPQLFNVLSGNMSLVGPRPEIPVFVNHFKENIPLYMIKHYVKPGMTGLAQIKGFRGDTSIEARIHEDIHYIENWSLGLDLYILLKTPLKAINKNERYVDSPEAVTDAKAAELLAAGEEAEREEARLSLEKPKERRGIVSWFAKKSAKTEEVSDTGIDEATAPPEENVPESEPSALAEDDKPQDKDGETDE